MSTEYPSRIGFVKLPRRLRDHWIWSDRYLRRWVDLTMRAVFEDCAISFSGRKMHLKRGQLITTYRMLGQDWGTNKDAVGRFIARLVKDGMISRETVTVHPEKGATGVATRLTIRNYDQYQGNGGRTQPTPRLPRDTHRDIQEEVKEEHAYSACSFLQEEGALASECGSEGGPPAPNLGGSPDGGSGRRDGSGLPDTVSIGQVVAAIRAGALQGGVPATASDPESDDEA